MYILRAAAASHHLQCCVKSVKILNTKNNLIQFQVFQTICKFYNM